MQVNETDEKGNEAYLTIIPGQEAQLRKILEDRVTGQLSVTNQNR